MRLQYQQATVAVAGSDMLASGRQDPTVPFAARGFVVRVHRLHDHPGTGQGEVTRGFLIEEMIEIVLRMILIGIFLGSLSCSFAELGIIVVGFIAMERHRDHRIRLCGPHPAKGALGHRESSHPYSCPHFGVGLSDR